MMICSICNRDVNSVFNVSGRKICNRCNLLITKKSNSSGYDTFIEEQGVVIWFLNGRVSNAWIQDGSVAVPRQIFEEISTEDIVSVIRLFEYLKIAQKSHWHWCIMCGKLLKSTDEIAHSHFAGSYCSTCATIYKEENSRRCGICGDPIHSCCC